MNAIEYTLYGHPKAWSRAGSSGARRFTPAPVRAEQERHREAWELSRPPGWDPSQPFALHVELYLGNARRVDIDNLAKLVMDALNHHAFEDDSQVMRLVTEKRLDRDDPRTVVRVIPLTEAA